MLKRLLASLAIVSLLIACALLVYWWRSNHGHNDTFTLGGKTATPTKFTTGKGRVAVEVMNYQGLIVTSRMEFYTFKNLLGYCLLLPALWTAVTVRAWLPRPPGRQLPRSKPDDRKSANR